jgi:hypothetical protein
MVVHAELEFAMNAHSSMIVLRANHGYSLSPNVDRHHKVLFHVYSVTPGEVAHAHTFTIKSIILLLVACTFGETKLFQTGVLSIISYFGP